MGDNVLTDPCVVFALHWEARAFLRRYRPYGRWAGAPCPVVLCRRDSHTVVVVETGVGQDGIRHLDQLFDRPATEGRAYQPRVVVSAGYSGALRAEFRVGDVLVGTEVVDTNRQCWPTEWPDASRSLPYRRERFLTVPALVSGPAERQQLARDYGAGAVDMEAAAVAGICGERGLLFGCVRVISDTLEMEMPPALLRLVQGSRPSLARLCMQVARSPRLIGQLWRLARHSRIASAKLADGLVSLLEEKSC